MTQHFSLVEACNFPTTKAIADQHRQSGTIISSETSANTDTTTSQDKVRLKLLFPLISM